MSNPIISVVIPVYNVSPFIEGCLTSVQKQTFQDFEVICIDDGSTDDSLVKMRAFADKDVRFKVFHQENQGVAVARNQGVSQSVGQYVFFLDPDDYLHPQTLEVLYHLMQKYKTDIAAIGFQKTEKLYDGQFVEVAIQESSIMKIDDPLNSFINDRRIITGVCTRLYKRALFDSIQFIPNINFEDAPFTAMVMANSQKMVLCDIPLYYYYQNTNSVMHRSFTLKKAMSSGIVIETIYNYIEQRYPNTIPTLKKKILNPRFKMLLNQSIRKQKDPTQRIALYNEIQKIAVDLYHKNIISYQGLKLKHRIALFLLLKGKTDWARKWMSLFG